jgi:NCAIR mutase (PurE)-related protein
MDVKEGNLDINEALKELKFLPYEDLGFAKVDHHRALRQGTPELFFARKTVTQVVQIADRILQANQNLLATRASFENV